MTLHAFRDFQLLKLKHDKLPSNVAFNCNCNLRRYTEDDALDDFFVLMATDRQAILKEASRRVKGEREKEVGAGG